VLVEALEAGFHVRATVRSAAKADKILAAPSIKRLNPGNKLEFANVPDMLVEGAYDEAIKGATFAIHVASPLVSAYKVFFIFLLVQGKKLILRLLVGRRAMTWRKYLSSPP